MSYLAAASQKSGVMESLLNRGRIRPVVMAHDEALLDAALGEQRRHAEAHGLRPGRG